MKLHLTTARNNGEATMSLTNVIDGMKRHRANPLQVERLQDRLAELHSDYPIIATHFGFEERD